ncbi:MAG TPA: serine hydrolase domain-containing protein, partial [Acidimicrobiales bacterium]|nr:serine hydrolase domain-containing protein [Acidimicrobiales bacterium]
GEPWRRDTLVLVFSSTKGATALCAHWLAERGLVDLDAPVSTYWPEFAQAGKAGIAVSHLLSHQAGLAWVDGEMSLEDALAWDPVVEALARQEPHWEPGTKHGYHAMTFGWLVGEVVRRASGRRIGQLFREAVAGPLALDFWIGLPAAGEPRVARLHGSAEPGGQDWGQAVEGLAGGKDSVLVKALNAPGGAFRRPGVWNLRQVRAAEVPAANGVGDARSLARMYAATLGEVQGTRVLGPSQLAVASAQATSGPDAVLMGLDIQFGLGFMVPSSLTRLGGPRSFGHFGAGGSVGWADPDAELAVGYVMNRMDVGLAGDRRSFRLVRATYEAAGRLGA